MSKPVTAASIYWEISRKYSREASFCANVITTRHTSALTRLRGMVRLLDLQHVVQCAPMSTDVLWIDGYSFPWSILELAGKSMKGLVEARAQIDAKVNAPDDDIACTNPDAECSACHAPGGQPCFPDCPDAAPAAAAK